MGSIVKVDSRPYRKIAQDNWSLTDEQMKGMHVHHRYPVSKGGTNDASNLFVCSPWFHAYVWHHPDTDHYHNWIASVSTPESRAKSWNARKDNWSKVSSAGGRASAAAKKARGETWGPPMPSVEHCQAAGKRSAALKYQCPMCGMIGNGGNIARHMKAQNHAGEKIKC
jgi:hypothetical protein